VDEYVIYQTLVGTWPLEGLKGIDKTYVERIQEYIVKVAREASRFTNWVSPDERYESALRDFVAGMLNRRRSRQFMEDMHAFVEAQLDAGLLNGLAQQVLKLTSPGVPDVYQGTEFWDDSLVDPDNRRHPDFDARVEAVSHLDDADVEELFRSKRDGSIKLYVTGKLLRFRREQKRLFERGDYVPVKVEGGAAEHVVAYLRVSEEAKILVVTPRLAHRLAHSKGSTLDNRAIWLGTTLQLPESVAGETWTNLLTGETVDGDPANLEKLFVTMPLAVLVSVREEASNG
jgi:(1->4)-alpha-D-glucan 1-alpha-D-glucosylmutase